MYRHVSRVPGVLSSHRHSRSPFSTLMLHNQAQQLLRVNKKVKAPTSAALSSLIPRNSLTNVPWEVNDHHFRWLIQKHLMKQDVILMGPPTSFRRRLVMALAEARGWEVEYVAITKDTTESDLKQRREIIGDTAVYVDQAPVRAAINGRILILDGLENAERNVLPTLNNLLENREMSLDDGRFLMARPTGILSKADEERISNDKKLVFVHENFRVIGLSVPVPSYAGRSLDPPLRSRFQCRFIDEYPSEHLLAMADTTSIRRENLLSLVQFYESLRTLRDSSIQEDATLSSLPIFSQDSFIQSVALLRKFPELTPAEVVSRFVPTVSWMSDILPERFQHPLHQAALSLGLAAHPSHSPSAAANKSKGSGSLASSSSLMPSKYSLTALSSPSSDGFVSATFSSAASESPVTVSARGGQRAPIAASSCDLLSQSALLPRQHKVVSAIAIDHAMGQHVCLLGPKGSGKSVVAREFARLFGYSVPRMFPLYKELTARDLLQRRVTDAQGNTTWADSPLIRAAREGNVCVLDGVHALDTHALGSLRRLLQDGVVDLPSGERLALSDDGATAGALPPSSIHPSFRVIALGLPASRGAGVSVTDSRLRYITSDLGWTYHTLTEATASEISQLLQQHVSQQQQVPLMKSLTPEHQRRGISQLSEVLEKISESAGEAHPELKPSFRHALNIANSLMYFGEDSTRSRNELRKVLENAFLIRYMPGAVTEKFEAALSKCGLQGKKEKVAEEDVLIQIDSENSQLRIGEVTALISKPKDIEKVPRPLFYDNAAHRRVLQTLLRTHTAPRHNSFLLIGNQGVGKNKLVDQMLFLLQREREYVQLHRDTTVQSLTVLPTLQDGQIIYEDSPLLRAAKQGRVLVIDEADKAPVEVISILKMLVEDGELVLYDGRRLLSAARLLSEGFQLPAHMMPPGAPRSSPDTSPCPPEIIPIHPAFRLIVLANRPGFPFHGNNLFRECGDVFSVHVVENLDLESEVSLLRAYAPDVPIEIIRKISLAFQDLRLAYENQELSYPYSAREAVSVIKHLQAFPEDGVQAAVEDILSFEGFSPRNRKQIAIIFQSRGLPISIQPPLLGRLASNEKQSQNPR